MEAPLLPCRFAQRPSRRRARRAISLRRLHSAARANENNLHWNDATAVRFEPDGTCETHGAEEAAVLCERSLTRDCCSFSPKVLAQGESNAVALAASPPVVELFCLIGDVYEAFVDAAYEAEPGVNG